MKPEALQQSLDAAVASTEMVNDIPRCFVRPSGTEDLLRIMVESKDEYRVNEITEQIVFIIVEQNKSEKNK